MVEIRGGGTLDGAQLIDAASDSTLRELITTIQMQGQQAKAAQVDQTAKQVKAADIDALTESTKKSTKQFDDTKDSTKSFKEKLDEVAKSLGSASATLASKGIISLFDFFNTGMDSFRQLSTIGAGFNGNLTELSATALNAGRSVSDFAKIVGENQSSLVALGGNAEGGARKLAEISGLLTQGQLLQRMSAMGMTVRDIDQATQAYLETQLRLGTLTRQNAQTIAEHTAQFSEGIDGVTRTLGLSRAELEKSIKSAAADPIFNSFVQKLNSTGGDTQMALRNIGAMSTALGKEFADAARNIAIGAPGINAYSQQLQQVNLATGGLIDKMLRGNVKFEDGIGQLNSAIQSNAGRLGDNIRAMAANGNEQARVLLDMASRSSIYANAQNQKNSDALALAADSFGARLQALSTTMGTAFNRILGAIISTDAFRSIEKNLTDFANWLATGNSMEEIKRFANDLMGAFQKVYTAMSEGWKSGSVWTAISAGLSSLWTDVGGVLEREFTNIFDRFFGKRTPTGDDSEKKSSDAARRVEIAGNQQRQSWDRAFTDAIESIQQKGLEFFHSLPTALTEGVDTAMTSLNGAFTTVQKFLYSLPDRVLEAKKSIQETMESISLESIQQKISQFFKQINTDLQAVDLTKITELATVIREINPMGIITGFERVPAVIDAVKDRLNSFIDDANKINLESIQQKISTFTTQLSSNFQSVDLTKITELATVIREINPMGIITGFERVPDTIERIKNSLSGFSDIVKNEIQKLNDIFKPGSIGPESIQNFANSLGMFESPLRTLINNITGINGGMAQGATSSAITSVLTSITDFIDKTVQGIQTLQNLSPEKMNNVIPTLGSVGKAINGFFSNFDIGTGIGAISNSLTGASDQILKISQVLNNFNSITLNPEKADSIIRSARTLFSGLNGLSFTPGFFNDDSQVNQVIGNIQKFQNINGENINGIVTSMNQLKGLGSTLGADVQGVATFTQNVSVLRSELEAGASAAERIKAAAGSLPAGTGGIAGANNYSQVDPNQMYQTMRDINNSLGSLNNYLNTIAANSAAPRAPAVTK